MDVIVNGPGKTEIVPDLKGSGPGGTFYFDEFIKYTQLVSPRNKKSAWTGSTSVGTNLNPDIEETAQELADTGFKKGFKPSLIYPSRWQGNANPNFDTFLGALTDRVQALRAAKPDAIGLQLDRLRESLKPMVDLRWGEQMAGFLRDITDWFGKQTKIVCIWWRQLADSSVLELLNRLLTIIMARRGQRKR